MVTDPDTLARFNAGITASRDAYAAEQHCPCGALTGSDATRRGVLCEPCKTDPKET